MRYISEPIMFAMVLAITMIGMTQCSSCDCTRTCVEYAKRCTEGDTNCAQLAAKCFDTCKDRRLLNFGK